MKFLLTAIGGLLGGFLLLWISIAGGFWKSDAEQFAESTCGPLTYSIGFQKCLEKNFGPGTSIVKFRKYVKGSGFVFWARKVVEDKNILKFIMIRDNKDKNHRHRIAIFVTYQDDKIYEIESIQGSTVEGWR